jgi:hypothetical protein
MTKPPGKTPAETVALPAIEETQNLDEVRAILWRLARDEGESGSTRVAACKLLLADAKAHDGGESHATDLNKRALALMRRVSN